MRLSEAFFGAFLFLSAASPGITCKAALNYYGCLYCLEQTCLGNNHLGSKCQSNFCWRQSEPGGGASHASSKPPQPLRARAEGIRLSITLCKWVLKLSHVSSNQQRPSWKLICPFCAYKCTPVVLTMRGRFAQTPRMFGLGCKVTASTQMEGWSFWKKFFYF